MSDTDIYKVRLYSDHKTVQIQAIEKIKKTLLSSLNENEINNLNNLLWECIKNNTPSIPITKRVYICSLSANAIVELIKYGKNVWIETLNNFYNIIPSIEEEKLPILVNVIVKLLELHVENISKSIEYKDYNTPFEQNNLNIHPLIFLIQKRPETWAEIIPYLYKFLPCTEELLEIQKKINNEYILITLEMLSPFIKYAILNFDDDNCLINSSMVKDWLIQLLKNTLKLSSRDDKLKQLKDNIIHLIYFILIHLTPNNNSINSVHQCIATELTNLLLEFDFKNEFTSDFIYNLLACVLEQRKNNISTHTLVNLIYLIVKEKSSQLTIEYKVIFPEICLLLIDTIDDVEETYLISILEIIVNNAIEAHTPLVKYLPLVIFPLLQVYSETINNNSKSKALNLVKTIEQNILLSNFDKSLELDEDNTDSNDFDSIKDENIRSECLKNITIKDENKFLVFGIIYLYLYYLKLETVPEHQMSIILDKLPSLTELDDIFITNKIVKIVTLYFNHKNNDSKISSLSSVGLRSLFEIWKKQPKIWNQLKFNISTYISERSNINSEPDDNLNEYDVAYITILQAAWVLIINEFVNSLKENTHHFVYKYLFQYYNLVAKKTEDTDIYYEFKSLILSNYILPLLSSENAIIRSYAVDTISVYPTSEIIEQLPPPSEIIKFTDNNNYDEIVKLYNILINNEITNTKSYKSNKNNKIDDSRIKSINSLKEYSTSISDNWYNEWKNGNIPVGKKSGVMFALLHSLSKNIITVDNSQKITKDNNIEVIQMIQSALEEIDFSDSITARLSIITSWCFFFEKQFNNIENAGQTKTELFLYAKNLFNEKMRHSEIPSLCANSFIAYTGLVVAYYLTNNSSYQYINELIDNLLQYSNPDSYIRNEFNNNDDIRFSIIMSLTFLYNYIHATDERRKKNIFNQFNYLIKNLPDKNSWQAFGLTYGLGHILNSLIQSLSNESQDAEKSLKQSDHIDVLKEYINVLINGFDDDQQKESLELFGRKLGFTKLLELYSDDSLISKDVVLSILEKCYKEIEMFFTGQSIKYIEGNFWILTYASVLDREEDREEENVSDNGNNDLLRKIEPVFNQALNFIRTKDSQESLYIHLFSSYCYFKYLKFMQKLNEDSDDSLMETLSYRSQLLSLVQLFSEDNIANNTKISSIFGTMSLLGINIIDIENDGNEVIQEYVDTVKEILEKLKSLYETATGRLLQTIYTINMNKKMPNENETKINFKNEGNNEPKDYSRFPLKTSYLRSIFNSLNKLSKDLLVWFISEEGLGNQLSLGGLPKFDQIEDKTTINVNNVVISYTKIAEIIQVLINSIYICENTQKNLENLIEVLAKHLLSIPLIENVSSNSNIEKVKHEILNILRNVYENVSILDDVKNMKIIRLIFACYVCDPERLMELISSTTEKESLGKYENNNTTYDLELQKLNIGISQLVDMECDSVYPMVLKQNIRRSVKYSKEEVTKKTLIEVFPVMENKRVKEEVKKDVFLMNISCIFYNIENLLSIKHKSLIGQDKLQWLQEILDLSILYRNEKSSSFYLRKIIFGIMNFLWTNTTIEDKSDNQVEEKDNFESIMNIYTRLQEENNNLVVDLNGFDFLFKPDVNKEKQEAICKRLFSIMKHFSESDDETSNECYYEIKFGLIRFCNKSSFIKSHLIELCQ
ncbi:hypothetical protein PIROE2DRAFT_59858 [Piromyces sp. E2]|nr:hypothetical protein PIROE2DRAFT_59858 [Piromyces sp. E2]|eukprot:OUM65690.1 hypothetical protein PIROE2DRAFT_59858 [Piromyces sp. E2]